MIATDERKIFLNTSGENVSEFEGIIFSSTENSDINDAVKGDGKKGKTVKKDRRNSREHSKAFLATSYMSGDQIKKWSKASPRLRKRVIRRYKRSLAYQQTQELDSEPVRFRSSDRNYPDQKDQRSARSGKKRQASGYAACGNEAVKKDISVNAAASGSNASESGAAASNASIVLVKAARKMAQTAQKELNRPKNSADDVTAYKQYEREEKAAAGSVRNTFVSMAATAVSIAVTVVTGLLLPLVLIIAAILVALVSIVSIISAIVGFIDQQQQATALGVQNVSSAVLSYQDLVEEYADEYGISDYVPYLLAIMQVESGGSGINVMQVSSGADTAEESIQKGCEYFADLVVQADDEGCDFYTVVQAYNFGGSYISYVTDNGGTHSLELAIAFAKDKSGGETVKYTNAIAVEYNGGWRYAYGNMFYVELVKQYIIYNYPANGMAIPIYYQYNYSNVSYGSGTIASCGCGPTSFAMVATYLSGETVTPEDAVSWCGNSYYVSGSGTSWSYFQAAATHFGIGTVTQTTSSSTVLQALSDGHPVISSQSAGLFTSGGHYIVLRGVTDEGNVLVNDPNDNSTKNYINREFDMETEIDATSKQYFIFYGTD